MRSGSLSGVGGVLVLVAVGLVAACAAPGVGPDAVPSPVPGVTSASTGTSTGGTAGAQDSVPGGAVGAGNGRGLLIDAVAAGSGTTVRGYDRSSRALVRSVPLEGHYRWPVVATVGPVEGVSYNGATVVLAGPASATASRFVVLNAELTAPPRVVTLPPGFSYDALSPDGSTLYLVEHLGPGASEHYQVRSYDLGAGRLDDAVIADKTRVAEWMAGHPTARVTSADGSIVATMYERDGGEPFVHVLHAADRFATCIDLPGAARGLRLLPSSTGSPLLLRDAAGLNRFTVDTDAATVAGPAALCTAAVSRAALPAWARTGFSGDGAGTPHVTSAGGHLIAALFGFPLEASADLSVENKILWIPGPQPSPTASGEPLSRHALTVEGTLVGDTVRLQRTLPEGPGPSGVAFPQAGCWHLTLSWYGHTDTMVLPVG